MSAHHPSSRAPPAEPEPPDLRAGIPLRDPAALKWACETYWNPLCRRARMLLPDAHEAQDIAQEVLLRLLRKAPSYDPSRPLYPWLARICTNLCLTRLRAVKRFLHALGRIGFVEGRTEAPDQTPAVKFRPLRALQRLSRREREVLTLRFIFDVERDEIARLLDIDSGSVKRTISRSFAHLQSGPDGPELKELLAHDTLEGA